MKKPKLEDFSTSGNMISPFGGYDYEKYSNALELYIKHLEANSNDNVMFSSSELLVITLLCENRLREVNKFTMLYHELGHMIDKIKMRKYMKKFREIKIMIPEEMDSETAKRELGNAIYKISVQYYENIGEHGRLTDGKCLRGNGHHMAQNISEQAQKLWDERLTIKK